MDEILEPVWNTGPNFTEAMGSTGPCYALTIYPVPDWWKGLITDLRRADDLGDVWSCVTSHDMPEPLRNYAKFICSRLNDDDKGEV